MVSSSLRIKVMVATVATALASVVAYEVWCAMGGAKSSVRVEIAAGAEAEEHWRGQKAYAVDPVVGRRPSRSSTVRTPMVALDGTDPRETVKHRDANAFLRDTPLPDVEQAERVLVVGDSHLDGVVDTADNLTTLLERRAGERSKPVAFLNAGCGLYSLWQCVLRACDLLPKYEPKVVVVLVFMGNDFLELDNTTVPHLDDQLRLQPAVEGAVPETTSARLKAVELTSPYEQLFWQGLNQAEYVRQSPDRLPILMAKAGHAIRHMEQAANARGCRVLWAMLPSFDLAFPSHASGMGAGAARLVESGTQRRIRDGFAAQLKEAEVAVVDLEPPFRGNGDLDLYAIDFHIYRRGHRLAAESLAKPIDRLLSR